MTSKSQVHLSSDIIHSTNFKTNNSTKQPYDVYLGRGNDIAQWLGNRIYRRIINEYQSTYKEATCSRVKTQVAETIINGIYILKGVFYLRRNGIWVEASMEQALRRVKQALQGKVRFRSGSHIATTRIFLVDKDISSRRWRKSQITKPSDITANSICSLRVVAWNSIFQFNEDHTDKINSEDHSWSVSILIFLNCITNTIVEYVSTETKRESFGEDCSIIFCPLIKIWSWVKRMDNQQSNQENLQRRATKRTWEWYWIFRIWWIS